MHNNNDDRPSYIVPKRYSCRYIYTSQDGNHLNTISLISSLITQQHDSPQMQVNAMRNSYLKCTNLKGQHGARTQHDRVQNRIIIRILPALSQRLT